MNKLLTLVLMCMLLVACLADGKAPSPSPAKGAKSVKSPSPSPAKGAKSAKKAKAPSPSPAKSGKAAHSSKKSAGQTKGAAIGAGVGAGIAALGAAGAAIAYKKRAAATPREEVAEETVMAL